MIRSYKRKELKGNLDTSYPTSHSTKEETGPERGMMSKVMQLQSGRTWARALCLAYCCPHSFSLTSPSQNWVPFSETVHAEIGHLAWLSWLSQHPNLSGTHENTHFKIFFLEQLCQQPWETLGQAGGTLTLGWDRWPAWQGWTGRLLSFRLSRSQLDAGERNNWRQQNGRRGSPSGKRHRIFCATKKLNPNLKLTHRWSGRAPVIWWVLWGSGCLKIPPLPTCLGHPPFLSGLQFWPDRS